jgi:hypothetical protein
MANWPKFCKYHILQFDKILEVLNFQGIQNIEGYMSSPGIYACLSKTAEIMIYQGYLLICHSFRPFFGNKYAKG